MIGVFFSQMLAFEPDVHVIYMYIWQILFLCL